MGNVGQRQANKSRDLILGIVFDLIGMSTYSVPIVGEFLDIGWAPISGFLMVWMYKGTAGKVGGIFSTLEELLPFTDFVPSFTLMWLYTYVFKKQSSR
ncbi:MAG: hypothetical protein EOP06_11655 [Proteobacteria bacterium]|nr:MAG: hypothetical protein EOP06_11655 [Pseudomonadota bacterium]